MMNLKNMSTGEEEKVAINQIREFVAKLNKR
jgi:hypothetical protein